MYFWDPDVFLSFLKGGAVQIVSLSYFKKSWHFSCQKWQKSAVGDKLADVHSLF